MNNLSIIIPTLNEERRISPLLEYLQTSSGDVEIIVVDGGSRDGTLERVGEVARVLRSIRVLTSVRGRATQMNSGARVATGEVLWFLHADCRPHPEAIPAMRQVLRNPHVIGGAFEYALDAPGAFFRVIEAVSNRKNRLAGLVCGDMGIFIRADVFHTLGGFREWPFMEDLDLCRRMKRLGRIAILPPRIATSAARWHEEGVLYNLMRNWCLQSAWFLGAAPETLARFYAFPPERNRPWTWKWKPRPAPGRISTKP
jgi:rSAM/selenodomain-associated transferase 2